MFENTFCKLWHADCLLIVQTRSGFLTVFYRIAIEISVYQNESCVNDSFIFMPEHICGPRAKAGCKRMSEHSTFVPRPQICFIYLPEFASSAHGESEPPLAI